MKDTDIAWAAGLFEGEGSIFIVNQKSKGKIYQYSRLELKMTDLDIVVKFRDILGVGNIHHKIRENPKWKNSYCWQLTNRAQCEEVIRLFWPYLGLRRKDQAMFAELDPM